MPKTADQTRAEIIAEIEAYKPTPEWQAIFDRAKEDDERRAKRMDAQRRRRVSREHG
jgi:hypothetical protein